MIDTYKIINKENKEVLCIYFNFNYEIGKEDFKNIKETLEEKIKKYIYENNIIFKGTTVLLLSGSIIFGTINISENKQPQYKKIVEKLVTEEYPNKIENDITIKQTQETNNEKENIKEEMPIQEPEIKKENINKETKKEESKIIKPIEKEEIKEEPQINENIKENVITEIEETKVDNNIYIKVKRKTGEIINIELEEYVIGVIGAEMPASFEIEALKSQAVIARTYALKAYSQEKILSDNESTQSYKTNEELKNTWNSSYDKYYNKIKQAALATEGMYLTYNGKYIEAIYHSTSNGKTEDAYNVWGNYYPYLISVESKYDNNNPSYEKEVTMTYDEITSKLKTEINNTTEIKIIEYTTGNRVKTVSIEGKNYEGTTIRNLLGLRSADFDIIKEEKEITFKTRGYGHGVGLSQYGANGYAKEGLTYKQILEHYYPNTHLDKM